MNTKSLRLPALLTSIIILLSLTGCTLSTSVDTLLTPPKLSQQQQQIYKALTNAVGSNINLQYPKSGKYLSAFIISDIDGDEDDEALVFYKKDSISQENALRLNILDKKDNKWLSVYDTPAEGNEIEKVETAPLGPADYINIMVGYSAAGGSGKALVIYQYRKETLNVTFTSNYNYYLAEDFNGDNENELFLIQNPAGEENQPAAVYYTLDEAGLYHSRNAALSPLASDFCQVIYGSLPDGTCGVYIDETVGSSLIQTEVLKIKGSSITNITADPAAMQRHSSLLSWDTDNDGEIEIPVQNEYFNGLPGSSDTEKINITSWLSSTGTDFEIKYKSYSSVAGGFVFVLPPGWDEDKIICASDPVTETIVFYRYYEDSAECLASPLLYIAAGKSSAEADDLALEGYTKLHEKDGIHTLINVPERRDSMIKNKETISRYMFFKN